MSIRRVNAYEIMSNHRVPVYQMVIVEQNLDCIKDFESYLKKHENYMTLYRHMTIKDRTYKIYLNRWNSVGIVTLHETEKSPKENYYVIPFDEMYNHVFEVIYPELFCKDFTIYEIPHLKDGVSSNLEVLQCFIFERVREEITKYLNKLEENKEEC